MIRAALLGLTLAILAVPASASAQKASTDPEMLANFDRAAAYWGASPDCPDGVQVTVDQAFVAPNAARADIGGCRIYTGDWLSTATPGQRCQAITHEWGHLLGYGWDHAWHAGLPADPVGVMSSPAMPASCAALVDPVAVAAKATWSAFDDAYVKWAHQRRARSDCRATANGLRRRATRVAARNRCVKRYGAIRRGPAAPTMPRPI